MSVIERDISTINFSAQTMTNGNTYKVIFYNDPLWPRTQPLFIYIHNWSNASILCASENTLVEGTDGVLKILPTETSLFVAEPNKNEIYLSGDGSCDINVSKIPLNFNIAPVNEYTRAILLGYTGTPEQFTRALVNNTILINQLLYQPIVDVNSSKTLELTDDNTLQKVTALSTITIPADDTFNFPINSRISIISYTTSDVDIIPGTGVTLYSLSNYRKLSGQYAEATLRKLGTNEWILSGSLKS